MKKKLPLFLGFAFLLVALAGGAGLFLLADRNQPPANQDSSPSIAPATGTPAAVSPMPTQSESSVPAGWLIFTSQEHGFQIAYPPDYQALDDADNLYGWPNGVVLFYQGGQAYDIVLEAWDNQSGYQAKYAGRESDLTAFPVDGEFITVFNNTLDPSYPAMVATFSRI
jgi:hypothetical protein